jgi:hypothetical protein
MTCFIFSWGSRTESSRLIDRQDILDGLDKMPEISNWRASTGVIFFVSSEDMFRLSDKIHARFPDLLFMITPIRVSSAAGWTDRETWAFIRAETRYGGG